MPLLDVANVACGFHGGDPVTMLKTVRLAKKYNKPVGAHPSLPDREGFGRRRIEIDPDDLYCQTLYQIGALVAMLKSEGMELNHVKPHGMMYRMMKEQEPLADAVMRAVKIYNVPVMGLPTTNHETFAKKYDIPFIPEFFPDLQYDTQGLTVPI